MKFDFVCTRVLKLQEDYYLSRLIKYYGIISSKEQATPLTYNSEEYYSSKNYSKIEKYGLLLRPEGEDEIIINVQTHSIDKNFLILIPRHPNKLQLYRKKQSLSHVKIRSEDQKINEKTSICWLIR